MTTPYIILAIYLSEGLLCLLLQRKFDSKASGTGLADKPRKLGEALGPVVCFLIYLSIAPLLLPFIVWNIEAKNRMDRNR